MSLSHFENATSSSRHDPKILDGTATRSAGMKMRYTLPVTDEQPVQISLSPGLLSPLVIDQFAVYGNSEFPIHGFIKSDPVNPVFTYEDDLTWRMVSCELTIENCGNTQDTKGTWTAVRVPIMPVTKEGQPFPLGAIMNDDDNAAQLPLAGYDGNRQMIGLFVPAQNFSYQNKATVQNNTFSSGDLKNLSKHTFKLIDESVNGHEWKNVTNGKFVNVSDFPPDSSGAGAFDNEFPDEANRLISQFFDEAFQSIYIYINPDTRQGEENTLNLMLHCTACYEYIPADSEDMRSNATYSPNMNKDYQRIKKKLLHKYRRA